MRQLPGAFPAARAFLVVWLAALPLAICFGLMRQQPAGTVIDFRSLYAAGYLVLHHPHALYDLAAQRQVQNASDPATQGLLPFFHLSYEALVYAPLALVSYRAAYCCVLAANLVLLAGCLFAEREIFSRILPLWQPRPGLVLFLFVPVLVALYQGQDSLLLLLLCCLVLGRLRRGQDVAAGALLGLALFKFEIALPLLVLLAARRGWRIVAGFAPVGVVLVGVSAALVGSQGVGQLRALLLTGSLARDAASGTQLLMAIHPGAMPNLMGLIFAGVGPGLGTGLGASLPAHTLFLVVLLASALTLGGVAYLVRRAPGEPEAFGLALLGTILVSYHLYLHDASLLVIPLALWASRAAAAALITGPPLLLVLSGVHHMYLLAIPIVWLLVEGASRGQPSVALREIPTPGG